MTNDQLVRIAAVVAAAALLASPYWQHIASLAAEAAETASKHRSVLARFAAAGLIVAAAWGKVPMPQMPVVDVPAVVVPEPSPDLQRLVEPVRAALASVPADKRAIWAATWSKAAVVVEAEGMTTVAVFTDTPALRLFTIVALDVAWRRLGDQAPGSVSGLREAVESVMRSTLGLDSVPVTADTKDRYAAAARAIAWAGTR